MVKRLFGLGNGFKLLHKSNYPSWEIMVSLSRIKVVCPKGLASHGLAIGPYTGSGKGIRHFQRFGKGCECRSKRKSGRGITAEKTSYARNRNKATAAEPTSTQPKKDLSACSMLALSAIVNLPRIRLLRKT